MNGANGEVLVVVGIGDDGWPGLTGEAQAALRDAKVIVGGARQLALLPDLDGRRIPLPSPLLPQLDELVAAHPGLCLLASGDPMLHGIGATLARRLGPGRIRVLPAVSSVALACARLGWAEHETDVVSVVSRPPEAVLPAVQPGARVLVLCRDGATPTALAALLAGRGWSATGITVLEHLGGPQERARGPFPAGAPDPGPFADLCVAALACEPDAPGSVLPRVPGLPDAAYETDGQLSIGIEWMRTDHRCRAVAVESRPDRADRLERNATRLGVADLEVIRGVAPGALAGLAEPDAVFIGGGVTAQGVLDVCWAALRRGGRLVAHAVTVESEAVLQQWQRTAGGEMVKLAVSYQAPLGGFTAWRPALPITQWQVIKP